MVMKFLDRTEFPFPQIGPNLQPMWYPQNIFMGSKEPAKGNILQSNCWAEFPQNLNNGSLAKVMPNLLKKQK